MAAPVDERDLLVSTPRDIAASQTSEQPRGRLEPRGLCSWVRRRPAAAALASVALSAAALATWRSAHWRNPAAPRLRGVAELEVLSGEQDQEEICGKVEYEVELHTSRLLYWISNIVSEELCCAECDAMPDCVAWTYGSEKAVEGVKRHCYLRGLSEGEEVKRINRSGLISGVILSKQEQKHGVVSNMLAKELKRKAEPGILDNQTCPGQLNISGYGTVSLIAAKWRTPEERAGRVEVPWENWAIVPHLRGRAYFGDSCSVAYTSQYARREYTTMALLGNALRYSVDLSKAGCGCNAQLHLVPMRKNRKESKCGDYYCGHGWQHCGVSCTEIGVQDANQYAWSTNLHLHDDGGGPAAGYGGDGGEGGVGRRNWQASDYGPKGRCIDTMWPFDVEVAFPTWPGGLLRAVEVTLSQDGSPCPLKLTLNKYHYNGRNGMLELTSILSSGVTPVIQYYSSENFAWLDGAGEDGRGPCVEDAPRTCPNTVRFYDFAVLKGLNGKQVPEPHENSVFNMAMDTLHQHVEESAFESEYRAMAKMEQEEEERKINALPKASRKELKLVGGGEEAPAKREAAGGYMEWEDGNAEWEITCEQLFVRSSASFDARVLATKSKGLILVGKRDGDWIRLAHESGYVAIVKDGFTLLKERVVAYEKIVIGDCAGAGMFPIEDESCCAAAGFALGYFDGSVHVGYNEDDDAESPEGCYLLDGQLFLSTSQANRGRGVVGHMNPICASQAYPTTTMTTTTGTTVTETSTTITSTTTSTSTTVTTTTTTTWGHPSLFCIEVTRSHGYELPLVKAQQAFRASIFSCEEYAVFSDGGSPQTVGIAPDGREIRTTVIPSIKEAIGDLSHGATTNSWLNTKTFLQVWDLCAKDGRYKNHDWTIKVDPDAVFFPERLRNRMRPHTMPHAKLFVMNCARYNPVALYGSIEIFSKGAIDAYIAGQSRCRTSLPWHGWGEDFFMSHCMDLLGVGRIYDFDLLSDKRCVYRPCTDTSRVAYHDYKDASLDGIWFKCWNESRVR